MKQITQDDIQKLRTETQKIELKMILHLRREAMQTTEALSYFCGASEQFFQNCNEAYFGEYRFLETR